ncbi:MAG: hypothetical protein Q9169_004928 [Polycauliona sp. 2 TL-2023]
MWQLYHLKPDSFTWTQSHDDPSWWARHTCGSEVALGYVTNAVSHGEYLPSYAYTTAHIDGRYCLEDLGRAARAAWRLLRHEEPQIAAAAALDAQKRPLLIYRCPQDEIEVEWWLNQTILVEASSRHPIDLADESEDHRQKHKPFPAMTAKIYIIASVRDHSTPLEGASLRILFQVNPLFFDGTGFRCMISSFFQKFVIQLSTPDRTSPVELDWTKSVQNLPKASYDLLAPDQYVSKPDFLTYAGVLLSRGRPGSTSWDYRTLPNYKPCPSQTLFYTFTKEKSRSIIAAVKQKLGFGYTVPHLVQAALVLALMRDKVPDHFPRPLHWTCPTAINGRHFLQQPYSSYKKPYFPNCEALGLITFQDVTEYTQDRGLRKDPIRTTELLVRAAKHSREGYEKFMETPHNMAITASLLQLQHPRLMRIAQPVNGIPPLSITSVC